MKTQYKENVSPLSPCEEYGLRKTIPFKLSSILKTSNRIEQKKTLAEVSKQYDEDRKKINAVKNKSPLIKITDAQQHRSTSFFKNPRRTLGLAPNWKNDISHQATNQNFYPQECCQYNDKNREQAKLNKKLIELISMINQTPQQQKDSLHRCYSTNALTVKFIPSPLIKVTYKKKNMLTKILGNQVSQNTENCQLDEFYSRYVENPSFLSKSQMNGKALPYHQQKRSHLTISSYIPSQHAPKVINQKRMSHYVSGKNSQPQSSSLCINCESYVNRQFIRKHEQECLGFKIILKMSNSEIIDLLNQKIATKINEIKQIEQEIEFKKQSQYRQMKDNCTDIINLCQRKNKIDQILTDLNAIRLKALKKFHSKSNKTTK